MTERAMILAAGMGLRMRPLTDDRPKPLVEVAGRALIDRTLDRLAEAGLKRVVVNLHYKAAMLKRHLETHAPDGMEIMFSDETGELLDTGGGVVAALEHLGPGAFFVVNSDVIWLDGGSPALTRMAAAWNPERMDALLLLIPTESALGYAGTGDYHLSEDGGLERKEPGGGARFLFGGIQILHPRLFAEAPEGRFSLNLLYDRAQAGGHLMGLRHEGAWMHVGTPDGVEAAAQRLGNLGEPA